MKMHLASLKDSKERLTALNCVNGVYTYKLKLVVIGESANKVAFERIVTFLMYYKSNKWVWIT